MVERSTFNDVNFEENKFMPGNDGVSEFLAALNREASTIQMRAGISLPEAILMLGHLES